MSLQPDGYRSDERTQRPMPDIRSRKTRLEAQVYRLERRLAESIVELARLTDGGAERPTYRLSPYVGPGTLGTGSPGTYFGSVLRVRRPDIERYRKSRAGASFRDIVIEGDAKRAEAVLVEVYEAFDPETGDLLIMERCPCLHIEGENGARERQQVYVLEAVAG